MRQVRVFFHDKCFDGAASAAVFTAFYRGAVAADAVFSYFGLVHKADGLFDAALFTGDDNAIVDFKYNADPRVTWWFDHHQSAFLSPADAEHFRQDRSGQKFYDPDYRSCTAYLADVARTRFGFTDPVLRDLISWADIVDGAQFPSVEAAVEMREPALQLTLAIEGARDPGFSARLIPDFLRFSLADLIHQDYVRATLEPLLRRHQEMREVIRERSECRDGVITFDLADGDYEGYNKFLPYYWHPEGVYSIGVSRSRFRMKLSVGSNPWRTVPRMENLAAICERYGGGGHARVGAISFPPDALDQARAAAREIAAELRRSYRAAVAQSAPAQ